jgi:rubrerythrin
VPETERFINDGRGWQCKRCRAESAATLADEAHEGPPSSSTLPRFFREGEAEEREARLSASALARWKNETRRVLVCPRCGVEEDLRK